MFDGAIMQDGSWNGHRAPSRRRSASENDELVMAQLRQANRPVSAYDIAARVSRFGRPMVPNQVYRTLARLVDQGHVVRIESLAAYFPAQKNGDMCLICSQCGSVSFLSVGHQESMLRKLAEACGYSISRTIIEAHGRCAACLASMTERSA